MGVTVSIGVSYNKIFAKLGSDYRKPDAVTVISKNNYKDIVWLLPAEDLLGVRQATRKKLYGHYVRTIGDIAEKDPQLLQSWLGKWGFILHRFANGQDHSPIERLGNESIIKSVGNSTTTPRDLENEQDCKIVLHNLSDSVAVRLRDLGLMCRTVQISARDNTLASFERQLTLPQSTCLASELCDTAMRLLRENYNWKKPIRSIGVRGMNLIPYQTPNRLSLFEDDAKRERQEKLERALDDVRRRFGYHSIGLAMLSLDQVLGRLDAKSDNTIHPVGYF